MNTYDEIYDIRVANKADIESIMSFIELYWKKDHILARNRAFFEYEFCEDDGTVNFIVAIKKETHTLEGIAGFLRTSHDVECMDVWGCMWRAKEGNIPFLGVELVKRMEYLTKCRYYVGTGMNPKTSLPLMKRVLHCVIGRMKQYYFLGKYNDFKIAKIINVPKSYPRIIDDKNLSVRQINSFNEIINKYDFEKNKSNIPYKDSKYVEKRFFQHPIYQYVIFGIYRTGKLIAFFVSREDEAKGRKVLRIVDYYGKQECFGTLFTFFDKIVAERHYEYIDFYCEGFEEKYILDAGFLLRTEEDRNIIPNYFHPFVQRNIEITTHAPCKGVMFYKADGDQDRPN